MKTAIIRYNSGNVSSVACALERIGANALITSDREEILTADRVIFPGVGEAGSAMEYLREKELDKLIPGLKQPVLGICLGMQLMCANSDEGNTACLGIFSQDVKKFNASKSFKVPHTGWDQLEKSGSGLFRKIPEGTFMYFVHSYYAGLGANTISVTDHGIKYSAALANRNFFGVQFHPERSGKAGEQLLKNFMEL